MAKTMNEQERLAALVEYEPSKHLVDIKDKQGNIKKYLPAAWRLYELSLRYTDANFSSEILYFDVERNLAIVKVRLYLGPDFETSPKKVEAMKSGNLSSLDKVETAAQARCARLFGVGTEFCLDIDSEDEEPASHRPQAVPQPGVRQLPPRPQGKVS